MQTESDVEHVEYDMDHVAELRSALEGIDDNFFEAMSLIDDIEKALCSRTIRKLRTFVELLGADCDRAAECVSALHGDV